VLTVADAFTGTAALGPEGRGALGQVLACGRTRIERAPLGDVHDRRLRHRLRQALVGAAADDAVLLRLADATLADLAPGTALLPDAPLGAHLCDARLFNLLVRQRVSRWSTLVGLRVGELRAWPGASTRAVAEIVGMVFERSLVGLASARQEAGIAAAVDLAILLDHEQAASRQPLVDALAGLSGEGHPDVVRRAAARLLRTIPEDAGHARLLSDILAAAGGPREVDVFVERALTLKGRPTIEEVARRRGVSAERVRQIRARAEERVRASAAAAPGHVGAMIGAVRAWLGSVVPVGVPDDMARRLGLGSVHTRTGGLLLWLAGPYLPVPGRDGWVALDPAQSVARTTEWLAQDGGVRPAQEVRDELAAEGVRAEHHDAWMAACGAVRVEDMVVYAAGGLATVAERALFAVGRGMTVGEIAAAIAAEDRAGELRAALRRDKRFARAAADVYELAEWGSPAQPGSPAPIEVTAPGSTSIDGRQWVRVPVEADVLRGDCRPVPVELVDAMSLVARDRRTFASRYGPVTILDEGAAPALGPLRHVALACGAQAGDELWLGFDPAGEVSVRLLREDEQLRAFDDRSLADLRPVAVTARGAR